MHLQERPCAINSIQVLKLCLKIFPEYLSSQEQTGHDLAQWNHPLKIYDTSVLFVEFCA
jgi:hypothetical protein